MQRLLRALALVAAAGLLVAPLARTSGASNSRITQGDAQAVLEAFAAGGRIVLYHDGAIEAEAPGAPDEA